MKKNALGMTLGIALSACHVIWLILVGTGVAKIWIDWVLKLHSMTMSYSILPLDPLNSALLIVLTFVVGYVVGFVLAGLWNLVSSLKKKR